MLKLKKSLLDNYILVKNDKLLLLEYLFKSVIIVKLFKLNQEMI